MANSQDFRTALDEMWNLHQRKNQDYGAEGDPYRNVRGGADWGVDPWVSAQIRLGDKTKRLQKYAQTGELTNENAEDSLIDQAVYAVISLVLWREQHKEKMVQKSFVPVVTNPVVTQNDMEDTIVGYWERQNEKFVSPKSEGC